MLGALSPRRLYPGTFSRLENEMGKFWEPLERYVNPEQWELFGGHVFPVVNVIEAEGAFRVTVELPGIAPEDVMVEFQNGELWISGHKKEEKIEEGQKIHRIERSYGEFRRKIQLPGTFAEGKIEAKFEQGVLMVVVPKSKEFMPKRIKVKTT